MADGSSPLQYLTTSSTQSLEAFELARLNCAANLRKQMIPLMDDWIQSLGEAWIARRMIEQRRAAESNAGAPLPFDAAPMPQLLMELSEVFARDLPAARLHRAACEDLVATGRSPKATRARQFSTQALPTQMSLPLFPEANALCTTPPSDSNKPCPPRAARPASKRSFSQGRVSETAFARNLAANCALPPRGKTLLRFAHSGTAPRVAQSRETRTMKCAFG